MDTAGKIGALGAEGNLAVQERLVSYLRGGRIHPAMVFSGPEPMAKLTIARNTAKFLLCASPGKYCNQCSSCRRIDRDIHPDVVVWKEDGEDVLKIDTIRQLCHQMELSPVEGVAKVCVLDECHRMNSAAANAFLKTLEEPGPGRYFLLLTTQVGSLLPTIRSRCLQFHFKPEKETLRTSNAHGELRQLFETFLQSGDAAALLASVDDKPRCLAFLKFLQHDLRAGVLAPYENAPAPEALQRFPSLLLERAFGEAVKLEGRLRSNANYALMLESYLRRCFLERQI